MGMNKIRFITTRPNLSAALLLLAIAVALMSPYLLQPDAIMWPRSELGTDLLTYRWPSVSYFQQSLQKTGEIPLWQTSIMGGLPLIGNPAVRVFYPPKLILSLLPIPILWMFALLNTLHFWVAGVSTFALARTVLKIRWSAAMIAALLLMLTPRLSTNIAGDLSHTHGLCLVPLCLLCIRLALDRYSWRWAIAAGISLSLLYLTNLQFVLYTGWFIGVYFVYSSILLLRERRQRDIFIQVGLLLIALIICLGFSAYQLFPFLSYLPYQSREAMTLENANHLALPVPLLFNTLFPIPQKFPEWEIYVGLIPLILSPLAWLHSNRRETRFWVGVLIFAMIFAIGTTTPLYAFMIQWIPGFRYVRVPARMWYFAAFAAAMLVSLAVDSLIQSKQLASRWWRWLVISGSMLIIITLAGRYLTRRPNEADWMLGLLAAASVIIGLVSLWQFVNNRLTTSQFAMLLIAAVFIDLFPLDVAFARPKPSAEVFELPEIGKTVVAQAQVERFRTYGIRREFADQIVVANRLEVVEGLNSFQFGTYSQFMRLASGCNVDGVYAAVPPCASNEFSATAYLDAKPDPALLGLLNVKYVISPFELPEQNELKLVETTGAEWLYENSAVLPRAFGVGRVEVAENDAAIWARLPQVDLRTTALVESSQAVETLAANSDFFEPAEILNYTPNQIHVRINMPDNGMLVFSEVWTPGWQVDVDGVGSSVLRVNGTLRGVMLAAGKHDVRLYFMPPAFVIGLVISLLTAAGSIAALIIGRKRRA